jgi:hypothetical protein
VDQLDILGGQRWDRAVETALQTCQGMIAVLSPDALASNNVMDEVSYALEERKIIIPILLHACTIPFRLRRVQYIDFTADYQTGFPQLLRALRIDQALQPRAPAVLEETLEADVAASIQPPLDQVSHEDGKPFGPAPQQKAAAPPVREKDQPEVHHHTTSGTRVITGLYRRQKRRLLWGGGVLLCVLVTAVYFALSGRTLGPQPQPGPGRAVQTQVQHRRALVIGNAAYLDGPLLQPVNDATAMAATLRSVGFEVTGLYDANKLTMEKAVEDFTRGAPQGSVGLFFFSGYGVQIQGKNYLIPLGTTFNSESDVQTSAVLVNRILIRMLGSGMAVKICILDASRLAPFMRQWRVQEPGLAPIESPVGSFVAFATAPGAVTADGSGKNGVYTEHLLRNITEPGLRIEDVFKRTRFGVRQETGGRQVPWENTSLEEDFYFNR